MKQLLASLMIIAVVGTAVGGTLATFSDTESSTGNTITAGTLDLVVEPVMTGGDSLDTAVPGSQGWLEWTIKNDGSLDGDLTVDPTVGFTPGAEPEPEAAVAGNDAAGGDLDTYMGVAVSYRLEGDAETFYFGSGSDSDYVPASNLDSMLALGWVADRTIPAGETATLKLYWKIASDVKGAGVDGRLTTADDVQVNDNIIQGDGMTLDIDFSLDQAAGE